MCDRPEGSQDFLDFICSSGAAHLDWRDLVMLVVGFAFIYVAVRLKREPYVLLPIGLGIVLTNLPQHGMTEFVIASTKPQESGIFGVILRYGLSLWNILPPIIFLGLGAMTDFTPVMANPKTLLLGAAAQVGIFVAFWGALVAGFDTNEAAAIGIVGGADGPTTIFLSAILAPNILGITAVIAYTYMASVVFIQPPLMKLLTTRKEREIVMRPLREVSDIERMLFPAIAMILIILLVPKSAPLISMFMIGNLFRESGVVPRLTSASSNELLNIATIFLMITVGTKLNADLVFKTDTLLILALGLLAFSCGTIGGLLFAKLINLLSRDKINPLIGSAGVSAVPMAARISHSVGQEANPESYLLSHAMGPNVAGVIGSAVVAGVFVSLLQA